ncbi:hypothetical protein [Polaromonas sp.]|uniref:hypothetical protein n=1 Tax=Polaromonas sp. TaxID=1869339 RepID=UPI0013B974B1|nr:hypothetical protein [Polaromonas sp.]NDP62618.1 hypothetical protein [Polaromonas sp.]
MKGNQQILAAWARRALSLAVHEEVLACLKPSQCAGKNAVRLFQQWGKAWEARVSPY